jgi:hypothetical protein
LKKRTKKLLSVASGTEFTRLGRVRREICKSFLLLFCKKEPFPSATPAVVPAAWYAHLPASD